VSEATGVDRINKQVKTEHPGNKPPVAGLLALRAQKQKTKNKTKIIVYSIEN